MYHLKKKIVQLALILLQTLYAKSWNSVVLKKQPLYQYVLYLVGF